MKKKILIILLSVLVLSCNSDNDNSGIVNIESTLIAKFSLFGAGEEGITEQNIVITNLDSWNNLITKMNTVNNVSDNFSEIDIDFSQYKVIAIFDRVRPTGGITIEMNIRSNSENIIVSTTKLGSEGINATTVITQPFHIVKISNSDLPIIFE